MTAKPVDSVEGGSLAQDTPARSYEFFSQFDQSLSLHSALEAAHCCGWEPPMLWVGNTADMGGFAALIAKDRGWNWGIDSSFDSTEWCIEWNGKRFGSRGV